MRGIVKDIQTDVSGEVIALIYSPRQKGRKRYPENCVQIMPDQETALAQADPEKNLYVAKVFGPARSSEGFKMFYLVEWIK